jgi:type I restriction enzyme, S subunit
VISAVISRSVGVSYPAINASDVMRIKVPLPPLAEQQTIAGFLDRETAKIDALVAEQERLIALLKEKRQAVISHAVTKGLNPNPPMKDSGVEWLGRIPEHWRVVPVKAIATLAGRIGFRGYATEDLVDEGDGAITLSPSNLVNGTVSLEKCTYISWEKYRESPEIMVKPLDVIIVKTGSTYGKSCCLCH